MTTSFASVASLLSTSVPSIEIGSFWLPKQSSTLAPNVDSAWSAVMWVSTVFFVLIIAAMTFLAVRYRRRRGATETPAHEQIDHSTKLEITWTIIPLAIVIALFFVGLTGYVSASVPPAEAMEVQVTAEKWSWRFAYPNGTVSANKLVVPKGRPVRLVMSSRDIVHSFFVPEFRIKRDVVPGAYTSTWFEATEAKETPILCAEYCGAGHSDMIAVVSVLEEPKFKEWLETGGEDKSMPPAKYGQQLFSSWGCATCHSVDGARSQGPTLKGLFGRTEEMSDGKQVRADESYLRESIVLSNAKVVKGYAPIMPVFQGALKDRQVDALVAYIKELK